MKKIYFSLFLLFTCTSVFSQLEGTKWKLAPTAQALAVGPSQGDFAWWSNSAADVDTRACLFDDQFVFEADGTFKNIQDGETWLETWQGVDADGCGTPVAPHDDSNPATWTYDEAAGTVTLTGTGAHLGLPKVHNNGELTTPSQAVESITYPVVIEGTTMTIDINYGGGFWHFVFEQINDSDPVSANDVVAGTWKMAPIAQALAVGPTMGDFSWWSNSAGDVETRACFFDDKFVFNADGSFNNVQDGETWIEPWQGSDPEACGMPVAPHDGSNAATWSYDEAAGTITIDGQGAHLGLAKVHNGGELTAPADAPASITYPVVLDGNTMTIDINYGGGFWHFVLQKDTGEEPPAPSTTSDVTFGVDMNGYEGEFTQVYVSGSLNNWAGDANPLVDEDGDGIWTGIIPLEAGKYEYKFTLDNWAVQEQFSDGAPCTETFGDNGEFVNRIITIEGDSEVCFNWNSCDACGTTPGDGGGAEPGVTFSVDMSDYTEAFTQVYLSGNLNGWAGDANPLTDEDADGIWTTTIPLADGQYDFKFTLDNWAVQEEFTAGDPCTMTFGDNNEFVNRVVQVAGDTEVCFKWNTCDACETGTGDGGGETPMGIVGTWKLAPMAQALAVGPAMGDFSWWSNAAGDVDTRACLFDDKFVFNEDGSFMNAQDGETWLEVWQGVDADGCGTPVAPHDGSNAATWSYDEAAGTVTLDGVGAHLGLPKVHNNGEFTSSAAAEAVTSITYPVMIEGNTMTVDINYGGGFWHFVFEREATSSTVEIANQSFFNFFPNPANTQVQVQSEEVMDELTIHDITGRILITIAQPSLNETIDVSSLAKGLYIMQARIGNKVSVEKLSIN